jgi:hypothetical protein
MVLANTLISNDHLLQDEAEGLKENGSAGSVEDIKGALIARISYSSIYELHDESKEHELKLLYLDQLMQRYKKNIRQ